MALKGLKVTNEASVTVSIAILNYPGALISAVQGLKEMFQAANRICDEQGVAVVFETKLYDVDQLQGVEAIPQQQVIILSPSMESGYQFDPQASVKGWLLLQHDRGAIICSVCAGAFILAATGLLNKRPATTHWGLAERFAEDFPEVLIDSRKILINDGDVITAGGLMAWVDLGLELVAQFTQPQIMRRLGKFLVVDTGPREQRYYRSFTPKLSHGDQLIVKVQHHLQANFYRQLLISEMAEVCCLTERTFLRRFVKATSMKPNQYLQQLRIQKACDLLEGSQQTIESITLSVGYEDSSAFRKTFYKIIGLTPREFRGRFGCEISV